jgi:3-keto-5-aminohexanoate cleavage enzyme
MAEKCVVTAALTGILARREQCPYLPYTPKEIADEAVRAAEAGASIVHIHARTDEGYPCFETPVYQQIYDLIRERSDVIINFSTGAVGVPMEQRVGYIRDVRPEIAALNMGSMNYAIYSSKNKRFYYDLVFANPFGDIIQLLEVMNQAGVRPELECFDTGHIGNTAPLIDMGILKPPYQFSLIMGVLGGIPATTRNLIHQVDNLPQPSFWQVIGVSRVQWQLVAAAITLGGNVRVGLEDNFYLPNGDMAKSNAELVEEAVRLCRILGREVATPTEAREILKL